MKISEIARLAGVSSAAVSRYFNDGSISEEKKQKIKKVIDETGYVPNPTARSLRQQRTDSVGVIVPKVNSDSVSKLIEGASSVLNRAGYTTIFANAENNVKHELEYLHLMQETNLAGIILMGTVLTRKHIAFFKNSNIPIVVCGQNHPSVNCIYHDDRGAGRELGRYVLGKGYRKLAYVGALETDESVGVNRRVGVEEAMIDFRISPSSLVRAAVGFTMEEGFRGMNEILDTGFIPECVLCATDTIAVGAMRALKRKNFKIPGDVAVCGIGGGMAGIIITPALTTVKLFHRESGERAAKLILSMVEQYREHPDAKIPVTHTMLGYSLVERESV